MKANNEGHLGCLIKNLGTEARLSYCEAMPAATSHLSTRNLK